MAEKPKPGRYTPPKPIGPEDIIKRAKEVAKNPAVPAGTRRTDVVIGICHTCGARKMISSLSRTCVRCWEKGIADELTREGEEIG